MHENATATSLNYLDTNMPATMREKTVSETIRFKA